jgi:Family of unknown function (DUF6152)/Tetratricopeptide repeat
MHKTIAAAVLAVLLTVPATAQTQPAAAEQLQRGIFAQETAGDLDGAIKIYRQIVDSHPPQREIAAQAQYRLGMTLLQKGDASLAAQEFQRLAWDFPDYKDLIDAAKKAGPNQFQPRLFVFDPHGASSPVELQQMAALDLQKQKAQQVHHDAEFDFSQSATVTGTVTKVQMMNPYSWLTVALPGTGLLPPVRVSLASPATLAAGGWSRDTVKLGDQVTVIGVPGRDGSDVIQATSVSLNGKLLFTRDAAPK